MNVKSRVLQNHDIANYLLFLIILSQYENFVPCQLIGGL